MIFDAPNTKRNRIAALIAIVLGLGVGFYFSFSGKKDAPETIEETVVEAAPESPVIAPVKPEQLQAATPPATPPGFPAGSIDDIDFNAYSQALAGHLGLTPGETRLDAIDKIRLYFAPEPGTNMVNLTSNTFELDDGSVMIFARNDLPDDSVFAEEVFAVFSGPGGADKFNQTLAAFGLRMKCRRGDNAMEWTKELCP